LAVPEELGLIAIQPMLSLTTQGNLLDKMRVRTRGRRIVGRSSVLGAASLAATRRGIRPHLAESI
jgi:hypothetical protein